MPKSRKPTWDDDAYMGRMPSLNFTIGLMAFWILLFVANLLGALTTLDGGLLASSPNLFGICMSMFFIWLTKERYDEQIERRADWRRKKFEAWLGRPVPPIEDY